MPLGWISAGIGTLGVIEQGNANSAANARAEAAAAQQAELIKRQTEWYDTMMGLANQAKQGGAFDPQKRLNDLAKLWASNDQLNTGNIASAMKIAGYNVGDTPVWDQLNQVRSRDQLQFNQQADDITRQALGDQTATFGAANPNALNAGIGALGQQQQLADSQIQSPAAILGELGKYFPTKQNTGSTNQKKSAPGSSASAASTPIGWNSNGTFDYLDTNGNAYTDITSLYPPSAPTVRSGAGIGPYNPTGQTIPYGVHSPGVLAGFTKSRGIQPYGSFR